MFQKNGFSRSFLYPLLFLYLIAFSGCEILFPPKILKLTVYPETRGYFASIQVTGMKPVLLIQSRDPGRLEEMLQKTKPEILVLASLNQALMQKIGTYSRTNLIKEFHFPEMDKRPGYLNKAVQDFKKRKIHTGPLRQNRYVPLRHAELIVLAPHEYAVYDENTRISFKLIRGKKSFVLASTLDPASLEMLTRSFGKGGLRTDILIGTETKDISTNQLNELFSHPKIYLTNKLSQNSILEFETDGRTLGAVTSSENSQAVSSLPSS